VGTNHDLHYQGRSNVSETEIIIIVVFVVFWWETQGQQSTGALGRGKDWFSHL
jgi:hypothetical protein